MRMRLAGFVAVACGFAPFGCSLLTSLDGLTGGAAPDATTEGSLAAEVGTTEAGNTDAPFVPADGGEAGEASTPDPCTGAIFCDHFERTDLKGDWLTVYTDNGGTAALDTSTFTSPTRSLALHVPTSPAAGDPHAELKTIQYDGVAHVRAAFAMKLGAPDRQMSLMRVQLSETDRYEVFDLFMLPDKIVASEQGFGAANAGYYDYTVMSGFVPDVWQHWTLELDATGTVALGIVTVDGKEVIRTPLQNVYKRSSLNLLLGAYYAPTGPPHDIFYDDVSITILP